MLKFTIDSKLLKKLVTKCKNVCDNKSIFTSLHTMFFRVDENNILYVLATDIKQYLELKVPDTYNNSPGIIGIELDDLTKIVKLSGDITITDVSTQDHAQVKIECGKKKLTLQAVFNSDVFLPDLKDKKHILTVNNHWLNETIDKLEPFTKIDEKNIAFEHININLKDKRFEALDGNRFCVRAIPTLQKEESFEYDNNVLLHYNAKYVLDNLLNVKQNTKVDIYTDKKWIKICNEEFIYIIRKPDATPFDLNKFIEASKNCMYSFKVNIQELLNAVLYTSNFFQKKIINQLCYIKKMILLILCLQNIIHPNVILLMKLKYKI